MTTEMPIPGYPGYLATSEGVIIGKSGRPLRPYPCGAYRRVGLRRAGTSVHRLVHVLVALAFIGPCPDGHEVNHCDGDGANNLPENLEYVTPSENVRHSLDVLGRERAPGEANGNARLTTDIVLAIRAAHAAGENCASIGRRFGVDHAHTWRIATRRSWSHVA